MAGRFDSGAFLTASDRLAKAEAAASPLTAVQGVMTGLGAGLGMFEDILKLKELKLYVESIATLRAIEVESKDALGDSDKQSAQGYTTVIERDAAVLGLLSKYGTRVSIPGPAGRP